MKRIILISCTFLFALAVLAACSSDHKDLDIETPETDTPNGNDNGNDDGGGSTNASVASLKSFEINIDKTSAEPTSTADAYYPEDEDNFSNNSFTTEVTISFSGNSATYSAPDGVTVTTDGAHVVANHSSTKSVHYIVSGTTTSGSLTILGDKKYELELKGVTITNPDSTAINLLSSKRAYIYLASGTTNKLTDGTSSKDENQKAAFYCKGKMMINGPGALEVYGNTKNAIASADYIIFNKGNNVYAKSVAKHAIKANDGIFVNGGIINAETSAKASKAMNCEADIYINGGRTTLITTGTGEYDTDDLETKGAAGMKADGAIKINGGSVYAKSTGNGGKGISADLTIDITGGDVQVITTGKQYTENGDDSKAKGIKADGNITISGGTIKVRATGGEGSEGIESKGVMTISNGDVAVYSYDDALNSKDNLIISGGNLYVQGTNNDAIDANKNLTISGGNIIAVGGNTPENPLDAAEGYNIFINGGNIFAIGGSIAQTSSTSSQASIAFTGSVSGKKIGLFNPSGTGMLYVEVPSTNCSAVMMTAKGMTAGQEYTIKTGVSVSGGTSFYGINSTGTVSGGNTLTTAKAAAQVGQGMGGPPNGGGPGSGPGH